MSLAHQSAQKRLSVQKNSLFSPNYIKLSFSSIFNPSCLLNLRILSTAGIISSERQFKLKKILVKQSYLLLLWLKSISDSRPGVVFLPLKGTLPFTKGKSPMAQKTFSQEQFKFQVYRYAFSKSKLKTNWDPRALNPENLLIVILNSRSTNFYWGTNFFFLKRFALVLSMRSCSTLTLG